MPCTVVRGPVATPVLALQARAQLRQQQPCLFCQPTELGKCPLAWAPPSSREGGRHDCLRKGP